MQKLHNFPPPIVVSTQEDALNLLHRMAHVRSVALDTETTGLVLYQDHILFWSLAFKDATGKRQRVVLTPEMLQYFREPIFENEEVEKIFTNALYDLIMLDYAGIQVKGKIHCTIVLDSLIDENRSGLHGLKECMWDYFGIHMETFQETLKRTGRKKTKKDSGLIGVDVISEPIWQDYASKDAYGTDMVFDLQRNTAQDFVIDTNFTLWDMYQTYFVPFNSVIFRMVRKGFRLDSSYLQSLIPVLQHRINYLDTIVNEWAKAYAANVGGLITEFEHTTGKKNLQVKPVFTGGVVNPDAPVQVAYLLTQIIGLPVLKHTKGGRSGHKAVAVDEDVLSTYASKYDDSVSKVLLSRRSLKKTLSTYVVGLQKSVRDDGKIHSKIKIMGARTGRLSCTEPNLQNIPAAAEDPFKLRRSLIADPGMILLVLDYKNLEVRILAHFSGCKVMIPIILAGTDMHCETAVRMFGVDYEEILWAKKHEHDATLSDIDKARVAELVSYRTASKTIGFGIIYGMQARRLSKTLLIPESKAEQLIQAYFRTYPGVAEFISNNIKECKRRAPIPYVQTWLKRLRRLPEINSPDKRTRSEAERQCTNTPIQGTAADITMIAMLTCDSDQRLKDLRCDMLLQVHDELVFQCPEENKDAALNIIKHNMEDPFADKFKVPILADVGWGKNWAEAK